MHMHPYKKILEHNIYLNHSPPNQWSQEEFSKQDVVYLPQRKYTFSFIR